MKAQTINMPQNNLVPKGQMKDMTDFHLELLQYRDCLGGDGHLGEDEQKRDLI